MNIEKTPPTILVACEYSGIVRDAFAAHGWDAWSCDLLPTEQPGNHYQGDVRDVLYEEWDLVIAHPPCTYLCSSGMHWTTRGLRDPQLTEEAVSFFLEVTRLDCAWAIENPVGCMSKRFRKPDQIIQPYQFGHDASKSTCLWTKDLPMLLTTDYVRGRKEGASQVGESDGERTKQTAAKQRSMEGEKPNVCRNSPGYG